MLGKMMGIDPKMLKKDYSSKKVKKEKTTKNPMPKKKSSGCKG
jgi:hypothetical protein